MTRLGKKLSPAQVHRLRGPELSRDKLGNIRSPQRATSEQAIRGGPAHLHALILDFATGQKVSLGDWPTPSPEVRFLAANETVLICTGTTWSVLSINLEPILTREMPESETCRNQFFLTSNGSSPDRSKFLSTSNFRSRTGRRTTSLDSQTLQQISGWKETDSIEDLSSH